MTPVNPLYLKSTTLNEAVHILVMRDNKNFLLRKYNSKYPINKDWTVTLFGVLSMEKLSTIASNNSTFFSEHKTDYLTDENNWELQFCSSLSCQKKLIPSASRVKVSEVSRIKMVGCAFCFQGYHYEKTSDKLFRKDVNYWYCENYILIVITSSRWGKQMPF